MNLNDIFNFLNDNSGVIQIFTTIILVAITALYVYFTSKITKLTAKQVISDIKMSNVVLGTYFSEQWFLKRIEDADDSNIFLDFKLLFDVYNKSSANGSITKPVLILHFNNDNFRYKLFPVTKERHSKKIEERGGIEIYDETTIDHGGAIFLRGGDFHKIELEYNCYNLKKELLDHIKNNLSSVKYYIKFSDNLGNKYLREISKIQSVEKTNRI